MEINKDELLEKVFKYIDLKGLAGEVLIEALLYKWVDSLVASTENTLDDGLAAILKPQIKTLAMNELGELIDGLLKKDEPEA